MTHWEGMLFIAGLLVGAGGVGMLNARFGKTTNRIVDERIADLNSLIGQLRAEKDMLLRTALDAKGVIVREQNAPPQIVEKIQANLRSKVAGGLTRLEREDAQKALDRDARVAQEIEEANRIARQARGADA